MAPPATFTLSKGRQMNSQRLRTTATRAGWACGWFALFAPCYSTSTIHIYESLSPSVAMASRSVMVTAEFVTLVTVACLSTRIGSLHNHEYRMFTTAGLLALSTLAPQLLLQNSTPAFVSYALAAIGGCTKSVGALAWLELFCTFEMRTTCIVFPAGLLIGNLVSGAISLLPQPWATLVGTVTCAASLIALARMSRRKEETPVGPESLSNDAWTFPWRPTVLMGVYSLASLLISACNPATPLRPLVNDIATTTVYLVLILATAAGFVRFDIKLLWVVAGPLVIGGAVCSLPALAESIPEGTLFSRLGFTAFSLYTYISFFNISYRFGVNPLWLFGFSRAIRVAVNLGMRFVDKGAILTHEYTVLGVVIVLVSMCASLFTAGETFDTTWGIHQVGPASARKRRPSLAEQCHQSAYLYGLTKREEEVLVLLAQNKSTPEIEAELCISNGTARNHIQHVYKKLDVHSRAEVAEFLQRQAAAG